MGPRNCEQLVEMLNNSGIEFDKANMTKEGIKIFPSRIKDNNKLRRYQLLHEKKKLHVVIRSLHKGVDTNKIRDEFAKKRRLGRNLHNAYI